MSEFVERNRRSSLFILLATLQDDLERITSSSSSLPAFPTNAINSNSEHEGGLLFASPSLLVSRRLFDFEPLDRDVQDLYSAWSPTDRPKAKAAVRNGERLTEQEDDFAIQERVEAFGRVPYFGQDVRGEVLGGVFLSSHQNKALGDLGGKWSSFEKRVPLSNFIGQSSGLLRSEVSYNR